eukprot:g3741.t1
MRRVMVVALAAGAARGVLAGGGRRGTRGREGAAEGAEGDGAGAGVGGDPLDEDASLFDPFREIKDTNMGRIDGTGEVGIEENVDPSVMMGGILGSALRAIDEEATATSGQHRRDLRPVFPDTPEDSGNENEDGAVLRPKIDPSKLIADLESDRDVREANEELETSDPSSAGTMTMTNIVSHAATAGNGFLPATDGSLQSIGPPSEDSSRTFNHAAEELDAVKPVPCRNHLNPRHCTNMVARTGPKSKNSFGGVFDVVGGLFHDSETSPSSSTNANGNISPGDTRTDVDHLSTQVPTGDYKADGWWSGLEAAVSDADHVVIEHRHLFEILCLVLFLLMATAFCVACCCCYSGKRGSSNDYGAGSQGSHSLLKSDAGYLDAVNGFDRYHDDEEAHPVDESLVINGDPSFNGNKAIYNDGDKTAARGNRKKKTLHGNRREKDNSEHRKVSKRKKKQKHKGTENETRGRKKRVDDTLASQSSLSHDLFGDDDDGASFDGGSLFGGKDDFWS